MNVSVAEIADFIGGRIVGDGCIPVTGLSSIRQAVPGDLTFVSEFRYLRLAEQCPAAAVLVGSEVSSSGSKTIIQVANPYIAFAKVLQRYQPSEIRHPKGIHPAAVVESGAQLGADAAVGAHAYVGEGAVIGSRAILYPNVYIGPGCVVGEDTIIYPNASIREGCWIGARCIIHCGAVIGSDGFGFMPMNGAHQKIPQTGIVEIGDDVEIGANTAIDRATFGKTIVRSGTKIDNLVQIGHNTEIGEHCIVCGNVGVAGSAVIGNHVTLAAGSGVGGHLEVGDHVVVAALGAVTKSVPPHRVVSGFPAVDHEVEKRQKASLHRLPDALRTLRKMERRIEELEKRLNERTSENDS